VDVGCALSLCPIGYRGDHARALVAPEPCHESYVLMNAPFDPSLLTIEKFAVGQPVSRKEDPVLLRGEGRYTDDLNRPDQLYGVMVRSRMAHGEVRAIDADAARDMQGVHAVITARDLDAAGIRNMPAAAAKHRDGSPTPRPAQRPLATDRVRYVGEPIAMVVADTGQGCRRIYLRRY
jgi:aerobic carbon-monoxide dehydrogenase large subunit